MGGAPDTALAPIIVLDNFDFQKKQVGNGEEDREEEKEKGGVG